jgi:maltose 6'-phosphate phosphatase
MKLLTLNCHSWQEENQLEKIEALAKAIQENAYDVIALQEVSQPIDGLVVRENVKSGNYVIVLLEALQKLSVTDYEYVWDLSHFGYKPYEEGLAILTKHQIEGTNSFFVSQSQDITKWKTRKIVGATIRYENELISFYSCHLGWWHDEEEPFVHQAKSLLEHVQGEERCFLMGDFNNHAGVKGEGYEYLMQHSLFDTYSLAKEKDNGMTVQGKIAGWDQNKQDLRIDLILTNQPCQVAFSQVIFNGVNRPVVSDHFGVEALVDEV